MKHPVLRLPLLGAALFLFVAGGLAAHAQHVGANSLPWMKLHDVHATAAAGLLRTLRHPDSLPKELLSTGPDDGEVPAVPMRPAGQRGQAAAATDVATGARHGRVDI